MLAVVLVALGSVLARAGSGGRAGSDVEAYVGDEVEALRGDVRADISRATKASHRVLGEQIAALGDTVEASARPDRGPAQPRRAQPHRRPTPAVGGHAPVTASRVCRVACSGHTETVQVTTRQTTIDDTGYGDRVGSVYGSAAVPRAVPGQRRGEHDGYKADAGPRRVHRPRRLRRVHAGPTRTTSRPAAGRRRARCTWGSGTRRSASTTPRRRCARRTAGPRWCSATPNRRRPHPPARRVLRAAPAPRRR
jgi:hypothetical protein